MGDHRPPVRAFLITGSCSSELPAPSISPLARTPELLFRATIVRVLLATAAVTARARQALLKRMVRAIPGAAAEGAIAHAPRTRCGRGAGRLDVGGHHHGQKSKSQQDRAHGCLRLGRPKALTTAGRKCSLRPRDNRDHNALTISSVIFLASPNSIMVLSR